MGRVERQTVLVTAADMGARLQPLLGPVVASLAQALELAEEEPRAIATVPLDVISDGCRLDLAGGQAELAQRLDRQLMGAAMFPPCAVEKLIRA
jgi:hypothetical protein